MEAFISSNRTKISLSSLAAFPPFLYFTDVELKYKTGSQSLITKFRLFEDCLESIKPALKDSNKIRFCAMIDQEDSSNFSDHSSVVIYLRDKLLRIFDSSHRYDFSLWFRSDKNSARELISSVLQIPQVGSSSNVSIRLIGYLSARLSVEDISNWLAPKSGDGVEIYGKRQWKGDRFLLIYSHTIKNAQEMWEHLKEVNFFHNLVQFLG